MTEGDSGGGHVAARCDGRKLFVGTLQVSAEQSGGSVEVIVLNAGPHGHLDAMMQRCQKSVRQ